MRDVQDARAVHYERSTVQRKLRLVGHENKLIQRDPYVVLNETSFVQHEAMLAHQVSRLTSGESRDVHHEARLSHCSSRQTHRESDVLHYECRISQHEPKIINSYSKLIQHESQLIQRQMYLNEKVRSRKMLLGSVTPSAVSSGVGRSRPSSVYRQRECKSWRKHAVSTDSGYSGASRWQSEAEDADLLTIVTDAGSAIRLRLPTKCRKCRRFRSEMKDASSQHSHPPTDDSRPSSPLTEILVPYAVEPPDVLKLPPPDRIYQCRVVRDKSSFGTNFYPVYRLYLERDAKPDFLLLVARKRKKCSTSKYLILTGSDDMSRRSPKVVGKLRSNLVGTRFNLSTLSRSEPTDSFLLFYETNILGTKGPRRMRLFLPENGDSQLDLFECYRRQSMDGVLQLVNKEPEWDRETLSHVLYFEGRVTKSSVKNFQLHLPPEEEVLLQFGKIGRDEFTLDYQRPLNAVQAFAIALSSFDYKIACE